MILGQRAMGHRLNVRSIFSSHGFSVRERWTFDMRTYQRRKLIGFVGPVLRLQIGYMPL